MAFRYRLQKILDFRIKKKEAQMIVVQQAQAEVIRIEQLIAQNAAEIVSARQNMRKADFSMLEAYDRYLKSLYDKETQLLEEKKEAEERLEQEKAKLLELEKGVKVLEKHKERAKENYIAEENAAELKRLSEVALQKFFQKTQDANAEEIEAELKKLEGMNFNEY